MRVVIAGGSGALGQVIAKDLAADNHDVVVLTRSPQAHSPFRQIAWDGFAPGAWEAELAGAAIINLAGESVDRPATWENVELLKRSRVRPTRALSRAIAQTTPAPVAWLQMSTTAIYGDAGDAILSENAPIPDPGIPQMTGVATAWEVAAVNRTSVRQVVLRTSLVLGRDMPVLRRLTGLARWGMGGRIGSGAQWVSWIHVDDFTSVIRRALADPALSGVIHVTSPNPVQNRELMSAVRTAVHRPRALPVPAALARVGAAVMRSDASLALTGRRCIPLQLLNHGFAFQHPFLAEALGDILSR